MRLSASLIYILILLSSSFLPAPEQPNFRNPKCAQEFVDIYVPEALLIAERNLVGSRLRFRVGGKVSLSIPDWRKGEVIEGVARDIFSSGDRIMYDIVPDNGDYVRVFILDASQLTNLDAFREVVR